MAQNYGALNGRRAPYKLIHFFAIFPLVLFIALLAFLFKFLPNPDHCNCRNYAVPEEAVVGIKHKRYNTGHRLAVLVPFRDRFDELLVFAPYMHRFLQAQNINHDIFVLNQIDRYRFNRASLINVGFLYVNSGYDYVAMHDVDLLPLNMNLSYAYPKDNPHHVAAPSLHPRYHYSKFVGGILLINREHFHSMNGMSNKYWGWGLEDDEFYLRMRDAGLNVTRPVNITTNTSNTFKHMHDKEHRKRDTAKCFDQKDGTRKRDRQTGLNNVNYTMPSVHTVTIDGTDVFVLNIKIGCDKILTPWCDCSDKT